MNILQIYKHYKIMTQLQLHQLRVTAVAKQIIDDFNEKLGEKEIITACLLHDMGNIIKFNLDLYPEFNEPEGTKYWERVRQEFVDKYGEEEHAATHAIAREIGISDRAYEILEAIGFANSIKNAKHSDFSKKIAAYADDRVDVTGIMSVDQRLKLGNKRYQKRKNNHVTQDVDYDTHVHAIKELEKQIFEKCSIGPEEIDDSSVEPIIDRLKNFVIN